MLIVDANILIRAVLGIRVRSLLAKYGATVDFFAPDTAYAEARAHLPEILAGRGVAVEPALAILESLERVVEPIDPDSYGSFEREARRRLAERDPNDWPVLAAALALSARYGRKIVTSSARALRPGQPIGSSYSLRKSVGGMKTI